MNMVRTLRAFISRGYQSPKRLLLLAALILGLTGCDPYPIIGPTCVNPVDNFKLAVTTQVEADNSKWVNTNIVINDGDRIEMELLERNDEFPVTLCGRHEYAISDSGIREKITLKLDAERESWTPADLPQIQENDVVYVDLGQPNAKGNEAGNKWSDWDATNGCDYPGSGGVACGGSTGTGSTPWSDDYDVFSEENNACVYPEFDWHSGKKCWHIYGTQLHYRINSTSSTSNSPSTARYPLTSAEVIDGTPIKELDPLSRALVIIDPVPNDGYLQFRMDDCDGCFDNNLGGHTLGIRHYGCPQQNGDALIAYIGSGTPDDSTSPTWESNFLEKDASGAYKLEDDSPPTGTLWLKIDDPDGDYSAGSNAGSYLISTKLSTNSCTIDADTPSCDPASPNDIMSSVVEYLVEQVEGVLRNAQQDLFEGLAGTSGGQVGSLVNFIRACLVLYIAIYGFAFAFGMIQSPQLDFAIRIIKVAIIIQLLGPNAWNFFNTYFFSLFTDGSKYLIYIFNNLFDSQEIYGTGDTWVNNMNAAWDASGHSVNFDFIDRTVGQVFEGTFWIKLSGLLFAGPLGWLYIIAIVIGMLIFLKGVIKAILAYVVSLIALAMLIGISPLFIIFALFTQTKDLFEAWVQQVVNYSLRPLLIFAVLTLFNFLMWATLIRVMSYGVCWKCILNIDLGMDFLPKLCVLYFYQPFTYDNFGEVANTTMPVSFFSILSYLVIAALMVRFIPFMEELASSITGSTAKASILAPAAQIANDMKKPFGMDAKSKQRRKQDKADTKRVATIKRDIRAGQAARTAEADRHAGGKGMASFDEGQKSQRKAELGALKETVKTEGGSVKDRAKALEGKLKGPLGQKVKDSEAGGKGMAKFEESQKDARKEELDNLNRKGIVAERKADSEARRKGMAKFEESQKDARKQELENLKTMKADERAGGKGMAKFEESQKDARKQELENLKTMKADERAGGKGMAEFDKKQKDERDKELDKLRNKKNEDPDA